MKKHLSILIALVMVLALFAGCSGGSTSGAPAGDGSSAGGSTDPDTGRPIKDEIIFAQTQDITTFDGQQGKQERTYSIANHIYDGLVVSDPDMNIQPCLATRWEWLDNMTLQFWIRKDVKFHNGATMTVDDVAYSINRLLTLPIMANNVTWLESCEIVDEDSVKIHLKMPYSPAVSIMTHPAFCIVNKEYVESDPDYFAKNPVGTGPYKMSSYQEGEYYTLERFDDYWGTPAKTKYLTMKIVPEAAQIPILLETGEIDAAVDVPMNEIARIKENPDLKIYEGPSVKVYNIFLNTASEGPLGNKVVRQALSHALDRQAIVDSVCYGYGVPTSNIVPPSAIGYLADAKGREFDLEKAKELLAQAGYPDGFDCKIWTSAEQNRVEFCQIFAGTLKEIGVNLEVVIQDENTSDDLWASGEDFDMRVHFFNCMAGHAESSLYSTLYSGILSNYSRYSNPEFDATVVKIRETIDEQEAEELFRQCYDMIYEDCPQIPVYNEVRVVATSAKLEGLELNQGGAHKYENACVYTD